MSESGVVTIPQEKLHLKGIHHITAISSSALETNAFYRDILGLQLIKQTVDPEDPYSPHLYFGDRNASPGSLLSFLIWPGAISGRKGTGEAGAISITLNGIAHDQILHDPHGLKIVVQRQSTEDTYTDNGYQHPVAILGAELYVSDPEITTRFFEHRLGMRTVQSKDGQIRMKFRNGANGWLDIIRCDEASALTAAGSIRHIALSVSDSDALAAYFRKLTAEGCNPSAMADRGYYSSFFVREPGGVLIELATIGPGFSIDESPETLGTDLMLPDHLESCRKEITIKLNQII